MKTGGSSPKLTDLLQLARQLESDRTVSLAQLRRRDHALGEHCRAENDSGRLLYWLQGVANETQVGSDSGLAAAESSPREGLVLAAVRLLSILFGALGMAGFLLASGRGLVNVFVFIAVFVLLQLLLCIVSCGVLALAARGSAPAVSSLNPLHWLASRIAVSSGSTGVFLGRALQDFPTLLRLLLLRYGQEMGALFTLGAVAAFFVVLGFSDFTFVWGSTFNISDEFLASTVQVIATPWSSWLPAAVPTPEAIAASRYHPTLTDLGQADVASMRQWWPFLITAMLVYALFPRLVLWLASRQLYLVQLRQAFVAYPGAKLALARMQTPIVKTQAREAEVLSASQVAQVGLDKGLVLVDWAGALGEGCTTAYDGLAAVPKDNVHSAGLGSLGEDEQCRLSIGSYHPQQLLVAVKSWEPPMLDLADFLTDFAQLPPCTLALIPLPDKTVNEHQLQEWRIFAQESSFDLDVIAARRVSDVADIVEGCTADVIEEPACP